ncbi:MAG: hypothetical protein KKD44_27350 [Proteobacteria bacterium]|nr:hypothetical protein [Pseudomonadota bacterium]
MKQFFAPLFIFVGGNLCLLIANLFMPAVDTVQAQLAADTAAVAGTFWGWSWLMTSGVARWFLYLLIEGFILFATLRAFLAIRNN